jgi:hypothetical protein
MGEPEWKTNSEEFHIFVRRYMHFINLFSLYEDFLSGRYVPRLRQSSENPSVPGMGDTLLFQVYAFFYSLIEDAENSINSFRLWRSCFPEEEHEIATLESQVAPFKNRLKLFRNRLGFHGSRSYAHEAAGFELFNEHTGTEIWNAMINFKRFAAILLRKDIARKKAARSGDLT